MDLAFNSEENARYARHFALPQMGREGQLRLKQSKVLVVGAGGLGSPVLLYLAAAGIGKIGIIDHDKVERHNLQRQVLYGESDIGSSKALAASKRILDLNPNIEVEVFQAPLNRSNALEIIEKYDIVADGTDNFQTRYLVNDACVFLGKTNVYASIFRFEGQVSVFNLALDDGSRGPNYRDLYPNPPAAGTVPDCAEGGVLGVLPGIIGSLQANEVIKIAAGIGQPLSGRLLLMDALNMETRILKVRKDPQNPINGESPSIFELIDYDQFCGVPKTFKVHGSQSLEAEEFLKWKEQGKNFQLIDVRELSEFELQNIGGELIPLSELKGRYNEISEEVPVIIHCASGKRSLQAIEILKQNGNWNNLYNLEGGIQAVLSAQIGK